MVSSAFWPAPPIFTSNPFLFTPIPPAAHLQGPSTARGPHPWAWPEEGCLFSQPAQRPHRPGLPCCESRLGLLGEVTLPCTSSLCPTPSPRGTLLPTCPPLSPSYFPGQVHPGHTMPGVRVLHSSGFTCKEGSGFLHEGWGEARRQAGREKFSRGGFGLLRPRLRDQGHGAVRPTGAPRGPPRTGKKQPLNLLRSEKRGSHLQAHWKL